ncbi:MAG: hypothetical protein M3464_02985 [Chloroflexota bacterium]|nr:hypothetical protein [Chloroflexota bacterium]
MRRAFVLLGLVIAVFNPSWDAAASDMTEAHYHVPVTFSIVPDPFYCQISPRPLGELNLSTGALPDRAGAPGPAMGIVWLDDPAASMASSGRPADPEIEAAVARTLYVMYACINAGDAPRLAAVWTDARIAHVAGAAAMRQTAIDRVAADPETPATRIELIGLSRVTILADGRIGWRLDLEYPAGTRQRQDGILTFEAGRYRLDQILLVTPLPAASLAETPARRVPCDQTGLAVLASTGPGLETGRPWGYFTPEPAAELPGPASVTPVSCQLT